MSKKSGRIAALIASCEGRAWDAHYLGYFECFNRQLFYEAHDVLEELWLKDRAGRHGNFYKAFIQFAGAFVHLQKDSPRHPRLRPAAALLRLARGYLEPYAPWHEGLDVLRIRDLAAEWLSELEGGGYTLNPLSTKLPPVLALPDADRIRDR